jgi:hypothetical protein
MMAGKIPPSLPRGKPLGESVKKWILRWPLDFTNTKAKSVKIKDSTAMKAVIDKTLINA